MRFISFLRSEKFEFEFWEKIKFYLFRESLETFFEFEKKTKEF